MLCESIAERARIRYRTADDEYEIPITELATINPDELEPVRRPPSYHEMRNYIGRCSVPTRGEARSVWFESLIELAHLRNLLVGGQVTEVATQPFVLVWSIGSGTVWHVPDIALRLRDGQSMVIDVTRRDRLATPRRIAIFELTAATLAAAGWEYQVRTELSDQRVTNLANVYACRHASEEQRDRWTAVARDLPIWPMELGALGRKVDVESGVAAVLHLVSTGRLFIDLDQPILPSSLVHRERPTEGNPEWIALS
ncbi:hypothetical protein [Jatrophihabitans fulvus]